MPFHKIRINTIKGYLMIQHFTTFRKPNRLAGQAPVVLTKRKIFPLDKRSAYALHVNHIFSSKDDSLLRCEYPPMFTTLYQLERRWLEKS